MKRKIPKKLMKQMDLSKLNKIEMKVLKGKSILNKEMILGGDGPPDTIPER